MHVYFLPLGCRRRCFMACMLQMFFNIVNICVKHYIIAVICINGTLIYLHVYKGEAHKNVEIDSYVLCNEGSWREKHNSVVR
jgi:hypothetical protein